ncbi:MAG: transposase [Microgenomates group bacterium]|jgi:putative transposase
MPAKNRIKQYTANSFYHLYNRGTEKRLIFQDKQDCSVFLSYLKEYLLPKNEKELFSKLSSPNISARERDKILKALRLNNFFGEIDLIAFSLMPNHFHLLIKQKSAGSIDKFMNSLGTRYTMYFNKKYKRVGSLYQGVYKAVLIVTDEQLLQLSRYIHRQALAFQGQALEAQPCSYFDYVGKRKSEWVKPEEILVFFSKNNPSLSYQAFVEEKDFELIPHKLLLDKN